MSVLSALGDARGRGWLEQLDPRLKLAWLAWVSSLSLLLDSAPALAALFALSAASATALRLRPKGWLVIGGLLAAAAWSTLLSQSLFYAYVPRTPLLTLLPERQIGPWMFSGLKLYREGAVYGLAQSLRFLSMTLAGLAVCLSTSPERLLGALARLRVSVALGFVAVTALRFLPLLLGEVVAVRRAMRLRGYRPQWFASARLWRTWPAAIGMELAVLRPVLANSLRRASALATSVTTRGFDPTARRTWYPDLRLRPAERLGLAALAATGLALAAAKFLYWLYLGELYYHPELRGLYHLVRAWL